MLKQNIQYHRYTDYVHPKDSIISMLNTALSFTPSKQSTIPYKVLVFGPNQTRIKDFLYQATINPPPEDSSVKCDHNHQVEAPWVLLFYERTKENSQGFKQDPETVSIEVGMFCAHLTQICLSAGLNVSYTKCFLPKQHKIWNDAPVKRPILALSIGIGEENKVIGRRQRPENKKIFLYK